MQDVEAGPQTKTSKATPIFPFEWKLRLAGGVIGAASFHVIGYFSPAKIPDDWLGLFRLLGFVIGQWGATVIHHGPPWKKAARDAVATGVMPDISMLIMFAFLSPPLEPYQTWMWLAVGLAFGFVIPILWATGKIR